MRNRWLLVVVGLVGLAGCAREQGYEAVRSMGEAKAQCERELTVAAQRACEAEYETSYRDYREERREAVVPQDRETEDTGKAE